MIDGQKGGEYETNFASTILWLGNGSFEIRAHEATAATKLITNGEVVQMEHSRKLDSVSIFGEPPDVHAIDNDSEDQYLSLLTRRAKATEQIVMLKKMLKGLPAAIDAAMRTNASRTKVVLPMNRPQITALIEYKHKEIESLNQAMDKFRDNMLRARKALASRLAANKVISRCA